MYGTVLAVGKLGLVRQSILRRESGREQEAQHERQKKLVRGQHNPLNEIQAMINTVAWQYCSVAVGFSRTAENFSNVFQMFFNGT